MPVRSATLSRSRSCYGLQCLKQPWWRTHDSKAPALVPSLDHGDLEIGEGSLASTILQRLLLGGASMDAAEASGEESQAGPASPQPRTVTTCAWIRPSIGPPPKRAAMAAVQATVAPSRPPLARASISPLIGVPWQ